MNRAMHATHARALIDAAGGLTAALDVVRACGHRGKLSPSQLSDYQNPNGSLYMPSDIVQCLQQHTGRRAYSDYLAGGADEAGDLREDACQAVEDAATLMAAVRHLSQGKPSPRVLDMLRKLVVAAEEDLARADADIEQLAENVTLIRRGANP